MLANKEAAATIAVKNLAKARAFYEGKLGFKRFGSDGPDVATYKSGNSVIVVYESDYAGTNKATSATWAVGDELEEIVQTLNEAGVPLSATTCPADAAKATSISSGISRPPGSRTPTATSCTSTAPDWTIAAGDQA